MKMGQSRNWGGGRRNTYRVEFPVPNWMKKRIMRVVNKIKPAAQPIFAGIPGIPSESCHEQNDQCPGIRREFLENALTMR